MKLPSTLLKSEISLHHKMTLCTLSERGRRRDRGELVSFLLKVQINAYLYGKDEAKQKGAIILAQKSQKNSGL